MNKKIIIPALLAFIFIACSTAEKTNPYMIIPEPGELVVKKGSLHLTDTAGLVHTLISEELIPGGQEAYRLDINPDGILISVNSRAGIFYGKQTLDQILPPDGIKGELVLPCVTINDWPEFQWRGAMLDVSRHFFPKEFILKYVDILAFHKLNHFHWHLTDGTAWRLEIDKYPELTNDVDSYSKDDVREIIKYAQDRFITIIPEIEMPGHSDAALAIFPNLRCDPFERSGVYCAGKEEVFEFLENVLEEVIELFPSDLIHVGGDEVGKGQWEKCLHCQNRIAGEGLENEEELQSYFIRRIAAFLEGHGKQLIGWDEIMEGGLPDNAKVMSWRGMKGGIEASALGHDVVMSPGYPCYFDHYQSSHDDEPQAWGGLNGLHDVYGFNPVPQQIEADKMHLILGGQANLWTEQIAAPEHAEYMLLPRLSALSEALWSGVEQQNWEWFEEKIPLQLKRYDELGYNYSGSALTPSISVKYSESEGVIKAALSRELDLFDLYYTLDGKIPGPGANIYSDIIVIEDGQVLKAQTFRGHDPVGYLSILEDLPNKATGKKLIYTTKWEDSYAGSGLTTLTDAQLASKRGDHPCWQGFKMNDLDVTVDLGKAKEVSEVWIRFFQHAGMTRVLLPDYIEVLGSINGNEYMFLGKADIETNTSLEAMIKKIRINFKKQELRYIRIIAANPKELFPGHPREGMDAWIFADELGVE